MSTPALPRRAMGVSPVRVLALTYAAYFILYFSRKSLSLTTNALVEEGYSEPFIAWVQTAFAAVYAAGQFIAGAMGDRLGPRLGLSTGLVLAGLASLAFGCFPSPVMLAVTISLSGLFQSSGWPNCCRILAVWVPAGRRGRVTSLWLTSYMAGGLAANVAGGLLLEHYTWAHVYLWTGAALILTGLCQALWLVNEPGETGSAARPVPPPPGARTGFSAMIREPAVIWLGFAYMGVRLVRYSLFIWLPYYLVTEMGLADRDAAWTSSAFEAGGLAGILLAGWTADRWFQGRQFRLALYLVAGLALCLFFGHTGSRAGLVTALVFTGIFMYAADTVIAGTAVTEIRGTHGAASAAGIVNGIGCTGQVCAGFLPVWIKQHWGWEGVFQSFVLLSLLSAAILAVPAFRRKG